MSVQDYLQDKIEGGELKSAGNFTLDIKRALERMAKHALPSEDHFLLKLVQLVNILRAEELSISVGAGGIKARFRAMPAAALGDLQGLTQALASPSLSLQSPLEELSSAILGSLMRKGSSVTWKAGRNTLSIDSGGAAVRNEEAFQAGEPADFELDVRHPGGWKLWKIPARKRSISQLLDDNCACSPTPIRLDGRLLETLSAANLNNHLREISGGRFNAATGVTPTSSRPVAATSIFFQLATDGEPALAVSRPDPEAYTQKEGGFNFWSQGLQPNNSISPDGAESPAWVLQFRDEENLKLEQVPQRLLCRAVVSFNIHGPGNSEPLRLVVIRHGVKIMECRLRELDDEDLEAFRGCVLLLADDQLETDLAGLRVVTGENFLATIRGRKELIDKGHEFIDLAMDRIHLV